VEKQKSEGQKTMQGRLGGGQARMPSIGRQRRETGRCDDDHEGEPVSSTGAKWESVSNSCALFPLCSEGLTTSACWPTYLLESETAMFQMRDNPAKSMNMKQALVMGLAIGMSLAVGRSVQQMMEPGSGYMMAVGVSALAAGATGGLMALMGMLMMRKR
jgi:hypothetical protein